MDGLKVDNVTSILSGKMGVNLCVLSKRNYIEDI